MSRGADMLDAIAAAPQVDLKRRPEGRVRASVAGRIRWANAGWIVLLASLGLAAIGLYGISLSGGIDGYAGPLNAARLVQRQVMFIGMGLCCGLIAALVHFKYVARMSWMIAAVTIAMLVFVLIPFVPDVIVTPRNGARRWINFGLLDFQPSELAKVSFVIAIAAYLRYREGHRKLFGLAPPALIAIVPMVLILVEPDLGTSLLFLPVLLAMLIAAGARLAHLFGTVALGAVFAVLIVVVSLSQAKHDRYPLLRPHQVNRILAVIEQHQGDERHLQSRGFQGNQAQMLAGSGGMFGHEEHKSRALIEFSRVPEKQNDMIFAVIVNRFGLVGALVVAGLYIAWFWGAMVVAAVATHPFARLLAVGLGTMVLMQATINMGMTIGLLPITGITLPFVSYGGSSLLIAFVMVGLIVNVALRRPEYLWRPSFEFA
ncbi:MAG: FtsW/RodA/SpoVE family cell cycle protein [Phycisphaerales bacterium]|nr:FtsW/RodA/SpoVE family cell cycle protein [Phycisphaerales bacterium]